MIHFTKKLPPSREGSQNSLPRGTFFGRPAYVVNTQQQNRVVSFGGFLGALAEAVIQIIASILLGINTKPAKQAKINAAACTTVGAISFLQVFVGSNPR